jgi:hypothetical protein
LTWTWFRVADVSFFLGTVMDVTLGYFYVRGRGDLSHAAAGVAAASLWWLSSMVYLVITLYDFYHSDLGGDDDDDDDGEAPGKETTIPKSMMMLEFPKRCSPLTVSSPVPFDEIVDWNRHKRDVVEGEVEL